MTADESGGGTKRKFKKSSHQQSDKKSKPTTPTKELSSSAQRRAVKHERQSHRRHATIVRDAKDIWNKLRLKTNSKDEITQLQADLMTLLFSTDTNLVGEIALQHDASRVVQAAVQFAKPEQRLELTKALSSQMVEMAKNPYAHFCVLKVIQYGHTHDETAKILLQSLKGHLCKLSVHAVGARVVEMLFSTLSSKQTKPLRQEFYGPHFSLFSTDTEMGGTLKENLAKQPQHETTSCEYLHHHILSKGMEKNLYGFGYFQQLLWEYAEVLKPPEFVKSGLLATLSDQSLVLVSTRAGARLVVWCIAYGSAKDRRKIMKGFKGYTRSSLLHRDAYLALLQLLLVTDDTVTLHRQCLTELVSTAEDKKKEEQPHPLLELALDENASKVCLLLLTSLKDEHKKYLDPLEWEILESSPKLNDEPTSKKDPELRRQELLTYLKPMLKSLCLNHASELSTSIPGTKVLLQVYKQDGLFDDDDGDLVQALMQLVTDEFMEHASGHYFLQHLISCGKPSFADALYQQLSSSLTITNSRQAFVVLALLKQQQSTTFLGITATQLQQLLETKRSTKGATAGIEALLKFVNKEEDTKKDTSDEKKEPPKKGTPTQKKGTPTQKKGTPTQKKGTPTQKKGSAKKQSKKK